MNHGGVHGILLHVLVVLTVNMKSHVNVSVDVIASLSQHDVSHIHEMQDLTASSAHQQRHARVCYNVYGML